LHLEDDVSIRIVTMMIVPMMMIVSKPVLPMKIAVMLAPTGMPMTMMIAAGINMWLLPVNIN
jgi:hypothetical protein